MDARKAHPSGRGVRWAAWTLALLLSALPLAAGAAERVALVIGNSKYHDPGAVLRNPGNDADGMAAALGRLGFEVVLGKDLDRDGFYDKRKEFAAAAREADVALFFYAGHGMQDAKGTNWLLPVDAKLESDLDLEPRAVKLDTVMDVMPGRSNLVFLDACRNNPLARGLALSKGRSRAAANEEANRGLARVPVQSGSGMFIGYATAAGKVASDGSDDNSPFTKALLAHIENPKWSVGEMFGKVVESVKAATGKDQVPWSESSLSGDPLHLASAAAPPPPPQDTGTPTTGVTSPLPSGDAARAYEAAERLNTVAAYRIVVDGFPGSIYAKLAQEWIDKHEGKPDPIVVAGGDGEDDVTPVVTPPAPDPEAVEQGLGLSREERRQVQMGLAAAGYDPGKVDGLIGKGTREAIRRWQGAQGKQATGYLDADGAKALLGLGREHEAVPLRRFTERLGRPFSPEWKEDSAGWTDLHYAALLDLPGVVAALCDAGMDADTRLKDGPPPFGDDLKRTLAALGHEQFKDWKADGETPLMIAAVGNARNAAAALAACGASANAKTNDGSTPLHYAASNNALDVAKLLIDRGANMNDRGNGGDSPLFRAAKRNSLDVVKLFLDLGADVNSKSHPGSRRTLLFYAAWKNAFDVVKLLLDRGADVNAKTDNGGTPLSVATTFNAFDAAKLLVDRGAGGATPLHRAAIGNRLDVAKRLIDRGADVNAKTDGGNTPLHYAAWDNALDVVKLLIDRGADVNAKTDGGSTPLAYAVWDNAFDVAKLLIDRGADVSAKNSWDSTPLHDAAEFHALDVAKLLIDYGADVNAKNSWDSTPLHRALRHDFRYNVIRYNTLDMAKLLVESGADIHAKINDGETPLHYAAWKNAEAKP